MKNKVCYVFVFDGYSDWEPALVCAGLQQFTEYEVRPFSINGEPVTSAANLFITPQLSFTQLDIAEADVLILPGGAAWMEGKYREITPFVRQWLDSGKLLGAICDATIYLASEGLLDQIAHTSNDLGLLKESVPGYRGESHYIAKPAVAADHIITANGTASVPFAHAIFNRLGVLRNEKFAFWFSFFHQPQYEALWHE